jgi:hypothetical protein
MLDAADKTSLNLTKIVHICFLCGFINPCMLLSEKQSRLDQAGRLKFFNPKHQ